MAQKRLKKAFSRYYVEVRFLQYFIIIIVFLIIFLLVSLTNGSLASKKNLAKAK